jgi:tetratricopeptide (TPR) repeat protein
MIWIFILFLLASIFFGNISTDTDVDTTAYEAYILYNEGVYCSDKNDIGCALEKYKASLSLKYDFPQAHQNIALLLEQHGNLTGAIKHHEKSIEFAISKEFNGSALNNLAISSLKLITIKTKSTVKTVISLLQEAAVLSPFNSNIFFSIGLTLSEIDDHDCAMQYFKRTLEIEPNHSMALLNIGNYHFWRNDYSQANFYYEKSVESALVRAPLEQIVTLNNMGQCYREQGLYKKSLIALHKAVRLLTTITYKEVSKDALPDLLQDTLLLTATNIFAVKGLSCHWGDYEVLEELLHFFIEKRNEQKLQSFDGDIEIDMSGEQASVGVDETLVSTPSLNLTSTLKPLHSSLLADLIYLLALTDYYDSDTNDSSRFVTKRYHKYYEPYTFSLLRYFGTNSDRMVCQRSCHPGNPEIQLNGEKLVINEPEIYHNQEYMNTVTKPFSRSLRVGYLSYDIRNHPMGRLVQTLITSHNISKVIHQYQLKSINKFY